MQKENPTASRGAVVDAFGCHLVGIVLRYRLAGEDPSVLPRLATYSSTVITFEGYVYLLTAGHVINKINEDFANPAIVIDSCSLVDNFGFSATDHHALPFPWLATNRYAFDEGGLDIGLVLLPTMIATSLMANGIRPVAEENWRHQHTVTFDGHFLLGLPDELTPDRGLPGGGAMFYPVGYPLVALKDAPDDIPKKEHPQFFAKLRPDGPPLASIVGMSGGPIVGVRIEPGPRLRYWVVAVQSGWYRQRRLIYASPVRYFATQMADEFRRPLSNRDQPV